MSRNEENFMCCGRSVKTFYFDTEFYLGAMNGFKYYYLDLENAHNHLLLFQKMKGESRCVFLHREMVVEFIHCTETSALSCVLRNMERASFSFYSLKCGKHWVY